ncbi:MAG: VOC family protein [Actinomycetota bacterium]|nr:VOC family protein [Actinomycetota bacterium]
MELSAPDYVVLVVADLDVSLRFWTGLLGLPLGHRSGPYAQLDTGTTRLALYQRQAMGATLGRPLQAPAPDAPGFEVGFKVPDVDAAYAELVAGGARAVQPPVDQPWGQRTAYVADPDGHLVELVGDDARP